MDPYVLQSITATVSAATAIMQTGCDGCIAAASAEEALSKPCLAICKAVKRVHKGCYVTWHSTLQRHIGVTGDMLLLQELCVCTHRRMSLLWQSCRTVGTVRRPAAGTAVLGATHIHSVERR